MCGTEKCRHNSVPRDPPDPPTAAATLSFATRLINRPRSNPWRSSCSLLSRRKQSCIRCYHPITHTHDCGANGHNSRFECQNPCQLDRQTRQSMTNANRRLSAVQGTGQAFPGRSSTSQPLAALLSQRPAANKQNELHLCTLRQVRASPCSLPCFTQTHARTHTHTHTHAS